MNGNENVIVIFRRTVDGDCADFALSPFELQLVILRATLTIATRNDDRKTKRRTTRAIKTAMSYLRDTASDGDPGNPRHAQFLAEMTQAVKILSPLRRGLVNHYTVALREWEMNRRPNHGEWQLFDLADGLSESALEDVQSRSHHILEALKLGRMGTCSGAATISK